MNRPRSTTTARMYELLADGAWHDREPIVAELVHLVEPGKAFRQGETDRARLRATGPGPRVRGDNTTSIAAGARTIVKKRIRGHEQRGRLEQRDIDGRVQIRLAP